MGILFLLFIILVPYLWGCLITGLSKDKDSDEINTYVQGILVMFLVSFAVILVALKADFTFATFTTVYTVILVLPALAGIYFAFRKIGAKEIRFEVSKALWPIYLAAAVVGVFSIFLTTQSYVNDATIETVRTILSTGKIYVYSSLDGSYMVNGLPIYNKLFIIPMFYAVLSKITFTDITIITGIIVPVVTYVLNILIMTKIADKVVSHQSKNLFMAGHLVVLVCGTYLPAIAIPVSTGFALLRQGYTGYAWAYAVLTPFVALLILEGKYIRGAVMLLPIVGLLKLDSIFFAVKDFANSYRSVGAGGKLWILYVGAVIYFAYRYLEKKRKFPFGLIICGPGLIAAAVADLYENLKSGEKLTKENRYAFLVWMALAGLASVYFFPYKGAAISLSVDCVSKEDKEAFEVLKDWKESEIIDDKLVFLGTRELTECVRRYTTDIRPAYGRDFFEPLLTGYNYEYPESGQEALLVVMDGLESDYKEYDEAEILEALIENEQLGRVDVIVIKVDTIITEAIWNKLAGYGFDQTNIKVKKGYQYIHR